MARVLDSETVTAERVSAYETLKPLLHAMYNEFQELSKKKPEGRVSEPKVKIVNRLLTDVYKMLDGEPNRVYLDLLNEDDLPENSDVILILGQAEAATKAFYAKYYGYDGFSHRWNLA